MLNTLDMYDGLVKDWVLGLGLRISIAKKELA